MERNDVSKRSVDLTGQRFGRLVVLERGKKICTSRSAFWLLRCDCGETTEVRAQSLRGGTTRSCGCLNREVAAATGRMHAKHGHATTGKNSPTYASWLSMHRRCKEGHHAYAYYGGAGVAICERWSVFANFLADMGERPEGKTLDRYPNHAGNYEPGNCRWATKHEQALNRKSTVWIEINGERKCIEDWALHYGISPGVIQQRIRKQGWEPARAVTEPPRAYRAGAK